MSALAELAASSALEVIRARFPDAPIEGQRDDLRQRPAIGGFRTKAEARDALPFCGSAYVVPPVPDRERRWWCVPVERAYSAAQPGYLQSGAWISWGAPRWVGGVA